MFLTLETVISERKVEAGLQRWREKRFGLGVVVRCKQSTNIRYARYFQTIKICEPKEEIKIQSLGGVLKYLSRWFFLQLWYLLFSKKGPFYGRKKQVVDELQRKIFSIFLKKLSTEPKPGNCLWMVNGVVFWSIWYYLLPTHNCSSQSIKISNPV